MIVELGTGYVGTARQAASVRNTTAAASSGRATRTLGREVQGFAPASRAGLTLGALNGANKSAAEATSLIATASAGIKSISAVLDDMKVIAAKVTGNTLSDSDRAFLHQSFSALRDQIGDVVTRTTYDDVALLDSDGGAVRTFDFTVGGSSGSGAGTTVTIAAAKASGLASGLESADLLTLSNATSAEALVDTAIDAAEGIANTLRTQSHRINTTGGINSRAGAGEAVVRDNYLQYKMTADQARGISLAVGADAGIAFGLEDGGVGQNALVAGLVSSLPSVATSRTNDGGSEAPQGTSATKDKSSAGGDTTPSRSRVDIKV
jgi:flagellin